MFAYSDAHWLRLKCLRYLSVSAALGVGAAGPVAGGLFAMLQATFGAVAAGGVLAALQSMGE